MASGEGPVLETPENALIAKAVAGDKNALVVLLYRYYDTLTAHLRNKLPVDGREFIDVEDILQQAFIKAFQKIGDFQDRGPRSFFFWLRTIADHTCIDELRKRQKRRERETPWPSLDPKGDSGGSSGPQPRPVNLDEETPSRSAGRREAAGALQTALATLRPRQREAVSLVFLQELSLDEAAARMDTTKAAVHSLVYRGLEKLGETLGPMSDYLSRP